MQQHVVEHAAQRILGVGLLHGDFHRFADGDAQAAVAVGVLRQDRTAGLGLLAGAGRHPRAEALHHHPAIGLLVIAHLHHVDLHLDSQKRACHGERRAPLPGPRLRGQARDAFPAVVVRLGDSGVGLVAAHGTGALVLVVDLGRRLQSSLQPQGPAQRGGTPELVDLPHLIGDGNVTVGGDFLLDARHGEEGCQIFGRQRLMCGGMQRGRRRRRQVSDQIVPTGGQILLGHDASPSVI